MTYAIAAAPLWRPDPHAAGATRMAQLMQATGHNSYGELWQWSVDQPEAFWSLLWDFCGAVGEKGSRILVDRDRGTAFRFGCLLIACGIMLGRAVAGTWVDAGATLADFARLGWPAALLVASDIAVARMTLAREPNGNLFVDRCIGLLHLLLACMYVLTLEVPK